MPSRATPITLRAQALALLEEGISVPRIIEITSLSKATIYRIQKIASERGYDPEVGREFKDEFFTDAPHSGCPKVITEEVTNKILETVCKDVKGRETPARELGFSVGISQMSTLRIL